MKTGIQDVYRQNVCVLLSTYNGEKYLKTQIDSVLSQEGVNVKLVVRDDGSSDSTVDILKEYVSNNANIIFLQGNNKGVEESFYDLLKYSFNLKESDFYAFCDQDDVWFTEKLITSVNKLKDEVEPALFCANQLVTDSKLTPTGLMITQEERIALEKKMEINYFPNRHGCTMVWNLRLQTVLSDIDKTISFTPAHDVWLNLVAHCCGKVLLGEKALQYYRIHNMNVAGLEKKRIKRIKKGVKIYLLQDNHWSDYAMACVKFFPKEMQSGEGWRFLNVVSVYRDSLKKKIDLIRSPQLWKTGIGTGLFRSVSVLFERY